MLLLVGCGDALDDVTDDGVDAADDDGTEDDADEQAAAVDGPTITLRGQDFAESITIAEVYGQYLRGQGYDVELATPAGFRSEAFTDLESGELDMIVDYIGGALAELEPDAGASGDPDEIVAIIEPAFADLGGVLLDYADAVNGDAFVVRGDEDAETISDVADLDLVFGASAQCFERPQCFLGYTDPDQYGIEFADTVTLEYGPLLGEALAAGEVDAVTWEDTAPQIEAEGFKVLEDDLGLHPAQNIAPIISDELAEAYGDDLIDLIDQLTAMITTDDLVAWNIETNIEFRESDDVATEWLEANGLL